MKLLTHCTRTALLTLALTATTAAHALSLSTLMHLHPRMVPTDNRIEFSLYNDGATFRGVLVDGKAYTVEAHQWLTISAPAGTLVFAGSNVPLHRAGEVMLTITPELAGMWQPIR